MDRTLSLYMPADYECRIWDSFRREIARHQIWDPEGIRREIARHNSRPPNADKHSNKSEASPGWWAESTRPPPIFMQALHPSSDQWNHRWGKSFVVGPKGIDSWELWPRGPVRTVSLDTNEYVGANVIISPDADASKRSPQATTEEIDYCQSSRDDRPMELVQSTRKTRLNHSLQGL